MGRLRHRPRRLDADLTPPLPADLDLARAAATEAGLLAMGYFRRNPKQWEKSPGQTVTEADIAVDEYLKKRLLEPRPGYGWLSEETADDPARLAARRTWVVDPIDGTRSFAEGVPEFTICIALVEGARSVLGVVLNPATGELFTAGRGGGAWSAGRRLVMIDPPGLDGARIACSAYENRRRGFSRILPTSEVSSIGSLALKLALVAAGRFDGYLTWRRTHDWDVAAATLLVEEAGGVVSDGGGAPLPLAGPVPRHDGILAAAPRLHATLLRATGAPRAEWLARRPPT